MGGDDTKKELKTQLVKPTICKKMFTIEDIGLSSLNEMMDKVEEVNGSKTEEKEAEKVVETKTE